MIPPRQLIAKSLKHVQRHGWTKDALAAGAVELGLPPVAHGVVERGGAALVEEHLRNANDEMRKELDEYMKNPRQKSKQEIVEFALWSRLKQTIPVQSTWAQAMAVGARPENLATTFQLLGDMSDIVASKFSENRDDGSYEWYASRAGITAAYCACELHMLSDYSENYENTRRFLRNRIVNDGSRFMQAAMGLGDVFNTLSSGLGAGSNVGVKMGLDVVKSFVPNLPFASFLENMQKGDGSRPSDATRGQDRDSKQHSYDEKDDSIIDAKLPEGISLFGLVSRDVKEATDIVSTNNPDFTVIAWPMWESIPTDVKFHDTRRVVRLVHDKQNIVVDVLRM
jgi:ubiquinone biosynthesis protein COQ9